MYTWQQEDYDYGKLDRGKLEYDFLSIFKRRRSLTQAEFDIIGIEPCRSFKRDVKIESLSNKQLMLFIEGVDEVKKFRKKHKRVARSPRRKKKVKGTPKKLSPKKKETAHKEKYYKYLSSDQWKLMRFGLFYLRGEKCERCGKTKNLQVHHNTYNNVFSEKIKDLEILCGGCHKKEHDL